MTPFDARGIFHALRRGAIHNAENPASLLRFSNNHFHRIRGCTEQPHHFRHIFDPPENIDRKSIFHHDDKRVARSDRLRVLHSGSLHLLIVSVHARQARARCFVERDAELHLRYGVHDRLVNVFHGLDEMRLTQNDVCAGRDIQRDCFEFHQL